MLDIDCDKPLAHSVHEVRTLRELTARGGRGTQMEAQINDGDNYRRVVVLVCYPSAAPEAEPDDGPQEPALEPSDQIQV